MAPLTVISVRDLVVGFGDRTVLDHVSLDVRKGEILGVVGGSEAANQSSYARSSVFCPSAPGESMFSVKISMTSAMERATICNGEPASFSRTAHCSRR